MEPIYECEKSMKMFTMRTDWLKEETNCEIMSLLLMRGRNQSGTCLKNGQKPQKCKYCLQLFITDVAKRICLDKKPYLCK